MNRTGLRSSITATRPYYLWNYTEYLITTGDLTLWAWFNKSDLQDAYRNSTLYPSDFCWPISAYSSNSPKKKKTITACFQGSQRLLIMLYQSMNGLNDSRTVIYGEISTQADKSLGLISLLSRGGINVFVRHPYRDSPFSNLITSITSNYRMW